HSFPTRRSSDLRDGEVLIAADLRVFLRERLPDYMVPSVFVTLDRLPLTPSGNVDRQELAKLALQPVVADGRGTELAGTPVEEIVAGIWCGVLGLARVGLGESFFELGGHS